MADKMQELNDVNQSIEKSGLRLRQLEETVERMKSQQAIGHNDGGGRGTLDLWQISQQGGGGHSASRGAQFRIFQNCFLSLVFIFLG